MTVNAIPRSSWQDPDKPITGPRRRQPFRQGVIHWQGDGRNTTPADIAAHLRSLQASYLQHRGYSLGYGYAVVSDVHHPHDGTRWEIRGTDLNMASNPGRKLDEGNANDWTGSVLIIGPANRRISSAAAKAVRELLYEWHADAGTTPVPPLPHSHLDYTACCGVYVPDVREGLLDPAAPATLPPPPPPTEGDPNMLIHLIKHADHPAVYAQYSGGYKVWIRNGEVLNVYRWLTGKDVTVIQAKHWALFEATGPILGDIPAGVDTFGLPL